MTTNTALLIIYYLFVLEYIFAPANHHIILFRFNKFISEMIGLTKEQFLQHLDKQEPYFSTKLNQKKFEVDENIKKMNYPIIGNECQSDACGVDVDIVYEDLKSKGEYKCKCSTCTGKYQSHKQFKRHSLYFQVITEFHPQIQIISVIQQQLTVQFHRPKQFIDQLEADNMKILIDNLFVNAHHSNNLSQKAQRKDIFYSRCILDRVPIVIPVRHKNCKHQQCYELSSLINYQIHSKLKNQLCLYKEDMCQSIFQLDSQASLFQDLVLDDELFKLIKLSPPYTMEFIYDKNKKKYQSSFSLSDNIDLQLKAIYLDLNGSESYDKFEIFQNEVLTDYIRIISEDLEANLGKKGTQKQSAVKGERFKKIDFMLKDKYTGRRINWVGRCMKCQYNQIFDLKTTIARYKIEKMKNRQVTGWQFTCPSCNNDEISANQTIQRVIFSDSFLTEAIVQNNGEYDENSKVFKYDGEKAMLLEFKSRHRITEQQMKEQNQGQEKIKFSGNSSIYSQKLLKNPLILMQCKEQGRIDFTDFYQAYSENGYQFVNPNGKFKDGLIFCQCQCCNSKPITNFYPFIYYDELYANVLSKANLTKSVKLITFEVSSGSIKVEENEANESLSKSKKIISPPSFEIGGFNDMITSEEYQNLFKRYILKQGQNFEVQAIQTPFIKYEKGEIQVQPNHPQRQTQSAQGGFTFSIVKQTVKSNLTNQVFTFNK